MGISIDHLIAIIKGAGYELSELNVSRPSTSAAFVCAIVTKSDGKAPPFRFRKDWEWHVKEQVSTDEELKVEFGVFLIAHALNSLSVRMRYPTE